MNVDLNVSISKFDLRLRSRYEPHGSCYISVDASMGGKHIRTISSAPSLFYRTIEAKK